MGEPKDLVIGNENLCARFSLSFISEQEVFYFSVAPLLLSVQWRNRPRLAVVYGWLAAAVKSSLVSSASKLRHKPEKLVLDFLTVGIGGREKLRCSTSVIWLGKFCGLGAVMLHLLPSLF